MHPCLALECPEAVCILDFPGYNKNFVRFKKAQDMIVAGASAYEVAKELNIKLRTAQRLLHKVAALTSEKGQKLAI